MKIIIVGGGKVGEYLCSDLSDENDVVLIESNPDILDYVMSNNDIMGVVGNGASYPILVEAGVSEADVFISVTQKDELNIISSMIAKRMGAKYTIARVRNPEYFGHMEFVRRSLGIDLMLNPEYEAAMRIARNLKYPSAIDVRSFSANKAIMVQLLVKENSYLNGLKLMDFPKRAPKRVLICFVERDDEIHIPDGNFVLRAGDRIHVTGNTSSLVKFYRSVGEPNQRIRSVFIIGGGRLTYYILQILTKQNLDIKVVEIDRDKARRLSEDFPEVIFINDDGTNRETLDEENFTSYDACISLTGIDEENLIVAMYAKKTGIKKMIAKVNRTELLDIVDPERIQTIVTPKKVVADIIARVVRSRINSQHSNVITLYRLAENRVEAAEFAVKFSSNVIDIPLKDLNTKKGILIAYIIRGEELIIPKGDDMIKSGDRVIIISEAMYIEDIDDILNDEE